MTDFELPSIKQTIFVLVAFGVVKLLWKLYSSRKKEVKLNKVDWKRDVVYLFQFPRSPIVPNLSPFCLKLESWLRLKNIPYEVVASQSLRSKEGKLPFVELNGEQLADSQLIINKLSKQFNKEDGLNAKDWAVARALDRMIEDSLFYCLVIFKVVEHGPEFMQSSITGFKFPRFVTNLIGHLFARMIKGRFTAHGIMKHDRADLLDIQRRDLQAISGVLGTKYFLFGDEPTYADCTVFGHLATVYYVPIDMPANHLIKEEFTNLIDYMARMKERIFPDWNTVISK